jgi:hypothetical protein
VSVYKEKTAPNSLTFCITVKDFLKPEPSYLIAALTIVRSGKPSFIPFSKIFNPRILKIVRLSFINKERWEPFPSRRNTRKQGYKLTAPILYRKLPPLQSLLRDNPYHFPNNSNKETLFVLVVNNLCIKVISFNRIKELSYSKISK